MLVITAMAVAALILMGVMLAAQKNDTAQLTQSRTAIPVLGIQIICGDCSGEGITPRRTYLNRSGNCSQCGGHSFVLASSLYWPSVARSLSDAGGAKARVLPFKVDRADKIAV